MIPVWDQVTGSVTLADFDQGMITTLEGVPNADPKAPAYSIPISQPGGSTLHVNTYFDQPEAIFRHRVYPFVTIHRDDFVPAAHRWMSVGQLEFRAPRGNQYTISGRSGWLEHTSKIQAYPFDITYTVSVFDRYERAVQPIFNYVLRHFPVNGKLFVSDSLGQARTYEVYLEGSGVNLQELLDPVNRVRGYAITVRVEGELDLTDPVVVGAVAGFDFDIHPL